MKKNGGFWGIARIFWILWPYLMAPKRPAYKETNYKDDIRSVLQCVAVCCSVIVAVSKETCIYRKRPITKINTEKSYTHTQRDPWKRRICLSGVVQCGAVCYIVLQCVAVCCSVIVAVSKDQTHKKSCIEETNAYVRWISLIRLFLYM